MSGQEEAQLRRPVCPIDQQNHQNQKSLYSIKAPRDCIYIKGEN